MKFFDRIGFIGTATILWAVSAVGFFGSRFFTPLMVLALPFWFPGGVVLGVDEAQERYGYWGEVFYLWLLSLPCALVYAWLIRRRSRRAVHYDNAA